jgi:hypothetical protein
MSRSDEEVESDDHLPDGLGRSGVHHARNWGPFLLRFLLGGSALAILIAYTGAVRDYERQSGTLAQVVALTAQHQRILEQRTDAAERAAVLRAEFDAHKREVSVELAHVNKEIAQHDAVLSKLEAKMDARIRQ